MGTKNQMSKRNLKLKKNQMLKKNQRLKTKQISKRNQMSFVPTQGQFTKYRIRRKKYGNLA